MRPHPLVLALALAGCASTVTPPTQELPAAFTAPVTGGTAPMADWFAAWDDKGLTALQALAHASNPDLRSAAASVQKARAVQDASLAGMLPGLTAKAASTASDTGRLTTSGIDASWEADLFGTGLAASKASRRAEELALAGADISLMAEVADAYVQYRACRMQEAIYRDTLTSQKQTQAATAALSAAGLTRGADSALADAGVASAAMALETQAADCRILAQSLTVLTGTTQPQVDAILAKGGGLPSGPAFRVTKVPADALRQRPDVARAEASFAAAMARVGTARTALLPGLTLAGSVGQGGAWSFGPALSLPLFRGGANLRQAEADAVIAGESWRKVVIAAVAEIEGALTHASAARRNAVQAGAAVKGYASYFADLDTNWKAGGETLLNRESAARSWQTARLTEVQQRAQAVRQMIAL